MGFNAKCVLMMLYTCILLDKTASHHLVNNPHWAVIQQDVLRMVFALVLASHAILFHNKLISLILLF